MAKSQQIGAGDLTAEIWLLRKTSTRAATGGETIDYVDHVKVAALAEPIRSREYISLQASQSDIEIRFTIYYREDVRPDWRIRWRSTVYEIIGTPIDLEARKTWMELMCKTAQG